MHADLTDKRVDRIENNLIANNLSKSIGKLEKSVCADLDHIDVISGSAFVENLDGRIGKMETRIEAIQAKNDRYFVKLRDALRERHD